MNRFIKGMIAGALILIAGFCLTVLVIASNTGRSFGGVIRGWFPDPAADAPATEARVLGAAEAPLAATLTVRLCRFPHTGLVTSDVAALSALAVRLPTDGEFVWDDAGIARIAAAAPDYAELLPLPLNRVFYAGGNGGNIFLAGATVAGEAVTLSTSADAYVFVSREPNREISYRAAACGEPGLFRFAEPSLGNVFTHTFAAPPHVYGEPLTREPTCTEDGGTYRVCSQCGAEAFENVVAAVGHLWPEQGLPVQAATHTEPGAIRYSCLRCRETREESVPALGHGAGVWRVTIEPDCTHAGRRERVCTCGTVLETATAAALGHDWGEERTRAATCTEDGATYRVCTVCGAEQTLLSLPAPGHAPVWRETAAPTCTAAGARESRCTVCGERLTTEAVSPLGHDWGAARRTEATEHARGEEYRVCAVCGEKEVLRSWDYGALAPALGFLTVPEYLAWQLTKGGAGFRAWVIGFRCAYWGLLGIIPVLIVTALVLVLTGRKSQ